MNNLLQNITHALGWSIVHSLWQGILVYAALCIIYMASPRLLSKNKYTLAFLGQSIIFLLFIVTFGHYIDLDKPQSPSLTAFQILPTPNTQEIIPTVIKFLEPLFPWMSSLYIVGIFVQLIVFSKSFSKLSYLKTHGLHEPPMTWQQPFLHICSQWRINQHVRLFLSEHVSAPLTLGYLKPIILFPVAFANNIDIKQVESLIMHEIAHIKRHDYLLNLFKVFVETTLFFHPIIWIISRQIETDREQACDDMVVEFFPSPIAYAQALMSAELLRQQPAPIYTMAATGKKYHLLQRIQRITKMEKNYTHVKQHLIAVVLSSLALVTVAWISPIESTKGQTSLKKSTLLSMSHKKVVAKNFIDTDTGTVEVAPLTQVYNTTLANNELDTIRSSKAEYTTKTRDTSFTINGNTIIIKNNDLSPELKKRAEELNAYYSSPKWKAHIAKIEANAKKTADYYNSRKWKKHIKKIEANAKKIEDYYNSPEWKNHIAQIEANARKVEDYYNSPEWKNQIAQIEANAKKIEDYYNSPEWKEKISKTKELYSSPEYKEIQKKYQREIDELRDKKGLK